MLKNLRSLREAAGISQKNLAEAIGVSQQSINKYENHNIEPDIATLRRLADYFRTSIDYIVGHTDVRHRIEAVYPYDLNEREREAMDGYRCLTEKQQACINLVIAQFTEANKGNI